jgi:3',5'-cyclic-AMP phosphodiesterase
MTRPFLLAQLTDSHIGADWGGSLDPAASLAAVVDAVRAMPDPPDAVIVTGDLTNDGAPEQYAVVREQLERLGIPYHVLAGNHDHRVALRAAFGLDGADEDPVRYRADQGPLRLIALDTTIPGESGGALGDGQLEWLSATLADAPATPTVIAMHHPPLLTGVPAWDETAIDLAAVDALARLLQRHDQVLAIAAGHLHRMLVGELTGRPVIVIPSTYMQSELDWSCERFVLVPEPPAFALHALRDGRLISHAQPVARR